MVDMAPGRAVQQPMSGTRTKTSQEGAHGRHKERDVARDLRHTSSRAIGSGG